MRLSQVAFSLAFAAAIACAQAADKPCTPADKARAEKSIDNVVNWAQMHKAYVDSSHCDAQVADLYTDALLRLIVEWKNVDAFSAAVQKDAQFKEFIFEHLRSPAAKDDRLAIYSRCSHACPKGQEAFCAELGAVVNPPKQ